MIEEHPPADVGWLFLLAITSFAFTSGLIFGSMGLVVLPAEVLILWPDTQAASLGLLLAMTGITQLIAPVVGYLSDRCTSRMGKRRPFMLGGGLLSIFSLAAMRFARDIEARNVYIAGLFCSMVGMNTAYAGA